ncbi:hypothetical protein RB599_001852 [Gaeumannomyces hyphopodioides]
MEPAQAGVASAVPTTVWKLIQEHSTNPVQEPGQSTATNKEWAKSYAPITSVTPHSREGRADFEPAFLDLDNDDSIRLREPAYPPNYRTWRLEMEDVAAWFNAVSNVVLAAWGRAPELLQASHAKALTERAENTYAVDVLYSLKFNGGRVPIAIGEFKRNIIKRDGWEASKPSQPGLSRELRGYADKYSCPALLTAGFYLASTR